jgi:heme/copper-type cytochrome/quinol oxidase subunit 2
MNTSIWICAIIAIVIFGVMLHSVATFRSGTTHQRRHALTEVAWALVPILIVIAAAVPSLKVTGESNVVAIAAAE